MCNEQTNARWLTVYYIVLYLLLLQCQCIILRKFPEDDALVLKHVGAIHKEQYNKLSLKCAFVYSLYINACVFTVTVMKPFQLIPVFLIIRLMAMNCHLQASQQILPVHQLTQGFQTLHLLCHQPYFHSTPSRVWNHPMQLCLSSNQWQHTLVVTLMMMLVPVRVHRSVLGVTLVLSLLMRIRCQLM